MELTDAVSATSVAAAGLAKVDVDGCDATELPQELRRLKEAQSLIETQLGRLAHAADAAGAYIGTGARDISGWLGKQTKTSTRRNRTAAELGAAMAKSEELAAAVTGGRLSADQATAVASASGGQPVDGALLEEIDGLPLNGVRPAVEAWRSRTNPERDEDIASVQRSKRYVRLTSQSNGMTRLEGLLAPEAGAIVRSALDGVMNKSHNDGTGR